MVVMMEETNFRISRSTCSLQLCSNRVVEPQSSESMSCFSFIHLLQDFIPHLVIVMTDTLFNQKSHSNVLTESTEAPRGVLGIREFWAEFDRDRGAPTEAPLPLSLPLVTLLLPHPILFNKESSPLSVLASSPLFLHLNSFSQSSWLFKGANTRLSTLHKLNNCSDLLHSSHTGCHKIASWSERGCLHYKLCKLHF